MINKIKYFFSFIAVFSCTLLLADGQGEQFILATQPKAGTHLMFKLMEKLRGTASTHLFSMNKNEPQFYYPGVIEDSWERGEMPWTHLFAPIKLKEILTTRYKNHKKVILIRDIRDVYVSYAHHIYKQPSMTTEEKIDTIMDKHPAFFTMNKNLSIFLKNPNFLVVRFEDLVGPQGGGNKEKQTNTIFRIANFIGLPISKETASQYGDELFGDTGGTFRKGKIGSWKTEMNTDQKMWMKEHFAKELIELGYEKNYHWH